MAGKMAELEVISSIDGSAEPNLFSFPRGKVRVPLVVGLHRWSYDRFDQRDELLPLCQARGWALLLPEFRGPNLASNPRVEEACASELARQDIIDAVDHACAEYPIDVDHVFLVGNGGGAHMALMVAAHAPTRWCAVSVWNPVTDLAVWHAQNPDYAGHLEACCGGPPGAREEVDDLYRARSPVSHVEAVAGANVWVHHGRYNDVVPYTHTWELAQALEDVNAGRFFFEIFDGAHEFYYDETFHWFYALMDASGR